MKTNSEKFADFQGFNFKNLLKFHLRTFLGYSSFAKKNAPPSPNFYLPKKQQFSCYNPIKTTFLAVVVAPVPFPFDVQYLKNGVLALKKV